MFFGHLPPQWYFDYVAPILGLALLALFLYIAAKTGEDAPKARRSPFDHPEEREEEKDKT